MEAQGRLLEVCAETIRASSEPRDDTCKLDSIIISHIHDIRSRPAGPPMMRSLVRLGFHDCASESCDGCIDPDDGNQNVGLDALIEVLTPICTTYDMSSADCFAAAASMAVEELSYEGATLAYMPLFFGREDAASCGGFTGGNPEAEFPAGQDGVLSRFLGFLLVVLCLEVST